MTDPIPAPDAFRAVLETLKRSRNVLITTHVRPDGDALGTAAAMAMALRQSGIGAKVLLLSHLPSKYAFIFRENQIDFLDVEAGWPADFAVRSFDCLLVVDTGTWSQLPGLREKLEGFIGPRLVVDHHLTQEDWADTKLVITQAAAAGEIAAELLDRWPIKLDAPLAAALFLALASDTGWFQFSNTRPETFRLAARLMEAGLDMDRLYQRLYQNERAARVLLQTRAQESLELRLDNRFASMTVRKTDFEQTQAGVPDTENLINIPLQIATVEVSALFTEPREGGPIRVSLRSKGQVDVARFAEQFGGGGHARASGLKIEGTLEEAKSAVLRAMESAMA